MNLEPYLKQKCLLKPCITGRECLERVTGHEAEKLFSGTFQKFRLTTCNRDVTVAPRAIDFCTTAAR